MMRAMARNRWRIGAMMLSLCGVAAAPQGSEGQSVRVSGTTSLRYVEVRPLVPDSLPAHLVGGTDLLRQMPDGRVMRCLIGDPFCRGTRPAEPVSTVPVMQDLEMSVWGIGEGIHAYAQVRGRTAWGGNPELWPRAKDSFDLLAAYGELDRDRFRVRMGRQWKVSGLGFYNFDGLALAARPDPTVALEGYLGRSLVRGLNEPRTGGALQAIEPLAPVEPGILLGLQARYRPGSNAAFSALYHRDIRRDRAGLYAELAAADAVVRIGRGSLEGALEADVASGALNEARLRLRPAPFRQLALTGEVRRYRPYFELWTIWGAFAPVGYDEARLTALTARTAGQLIVRGEASYRTYEDPGMTGAFNLFRTDGWALGGGVSWAPEPLWRLEGSYRMEVGFGAARSEGSATVLRHLGDRGFIAARGLGFQRLYEFRLEQGTVLGLGLDTSLELTERARVTGGVTAYRHLFAGPAPDLDWNQLRGNLLVQWTIGTEPRAAHGNGGAR